LDLDNRIRIGGLKILEGGACVVSSSPEAEECLAARVSASLAHSKINLTFFTHLAGNREVLCAANKAGEDVSSLIQQRCGPGAAVQLYSGTVVLSGYPHDKRPEIIGTFIRCLARARVVIHGLASSPSAISAVLSARRKKAAVEQLFQGFAIPAFDSLQEFFAAQAAPEEYLQKVVATYQEKVIKVYCIVPQSDLDLWGMTISSADILEGFATAMMHLGDLGLTIPFLVAIPGLGGREFLVSFSTAREKSAPDQGPGVRRLIKQHLPEARPLRLTPVAGISLHGPHFGDRYGIVNTMVEALEKAHISLLALSCTISSISLVIRQQELAPALLILRKTFEAPVECPAGPQQ
jgi:hypothetical protein